MSEVVVRRARPDEFSMIGAITVAVYEADGLLVADPAYGEDIADIHLRDL